MIVSCSFPSCPCTEFHTALVTLIKGCLHFLPWLKELSTSLPTGKKIPERTAQE